MNTTETQSPDSLHRLDSRPEPPTVEEFISCIRVLEWMADKMAECNPTWLMPTNAVIGAVSGCLKLAERQECSAIDKLTDRGANNQ